MVQLVKNLPAMWETWVQTLGWEDPLEKGKATHSSILTRRIPRTIQSLGCKESDTTERVNTHTNTYTKCNSNILRFMWKTDGRSCI